MVNMVNHQRNANQNRNMSCHLSESVQFICSTMSDSLQPWTAAGQVPCPPSTPGAYSNSCPLNQWCHPTISSSVILFSSHLQFFPVTGSFPTSQFYESGGWSVSFSISPSKDFQDWFLFGWTGWISLPSKGFSEPSPKSQFKASVVQCSAFFILQLSYPYMTTGKTIALTRWTFVGRVMSLLFNRLSKLFITFLPRSKHLLISWLQSPSAVILEPPK